MAIQTGTWWKLVLIGTFSFAALCISSCGNGTLEKSPAPNSKRNTVSGKMIFTTHCAVCHGENGQLGASGASDLTKSKLDQNQIRHVIENGRNGMPIMKEILGSTENIESVSNYILELRK
jgi:mono/diheme cytochrome c family protein